MIAGLYLYISLTRTLSNSNVTQLMLCNSVPQGREGITPVLAIQPSTPDCYIGVAVFDTVYFGGHLDTCICLIVNPSVLGIKSI